jgi:hypothetical protein
MALRGGAYHRRRQDGFQISFDATRLTTGTWTDVNALDFNAPITSGGTGALDGNAAANRTALSATIASLNIANGATFWIRWVDVDDDGRFDKVTYSADGFSNCRSRKLPSLLPRWPDSALTTLSP